MNLSHKIPKKYECINCNYNTSNYKDYKKHLSTRKHINKTNIEQNELENPIKSPVKFICDCGKEYGARNSLWYHKKKCSLLNIETKETKDVSSSEINKDILLMLLKKQDFMEELLFKNQEFMSKVLEIMPQVGNLSLIHI